MAPDTFEDFLNDMSKPEVKELKHEAELQRKIMQTTDRSVVSFWWLCIPLYIVAALLMKSLFVPNASFVAILREFTNNNSNAAILLFLVLPLLLIIINLLSIKQLSFLYSGLIRKAFLKKISNPILIILLSLCMLVIYFLWNT